MAFPVRKRFPWVAVAFVALVTTARPAQAEVKRIVIDKKVSPAFDGRLGRRPSGLHTVAVLPGGLVDGCLPGSALTMR